MSDKDKPDNVVPMPNRQPQMTLQEHERELIFARGQLSVIKEILPLIKKLHESANLRESLALTSINDIQDRERTSKELEKAKKELEDLRNKLKEEQESDKKSEDSSKSSKKDQEEKKDSQEVPKEVSENGKTK